MQYRLGIATNRIKSGLDHIIKKAGVEGLFDEIVAFGDYDNPKPDPEPLLKAARLLKVSPHQAIYIGDSPTDIEAAKAAGMKSIHMSQYKHSDADAGIMSFYEVNSAVAKLDA
jgi:HAD superfamily hydrolase (TIGR01549 family)